MPHCREGADKAPNLQHLLTRAVQQAAAGDALNAQRTARTLEQLIVLDSRLKRRNATLSTHTAEQEHTLAARERELDARHVTLNQREFDLACEAQRLEELKESLEALYAQMYNKQPED